VDSFFADNPIENDKNTLSQGVDLLPYTSLSRRVEYAAELFYEVKRQGRIGIAGLFTLFRYLSGSPLEEAREMLHRQLLGRDRFLINYRFDIAKAVLPVEEFEQALEEIFDEARHENEPMQIAMGLSVILEVLDPEDRVAVADELLLLVQDNLQPDDEPWTQVLLRVIGAMEFEWCLAKLWAFVVTIGQRSSVDCARLLLALAKKAPDKAAVEFARLAENAFPTVRWTASQQIELLPYLDPAARISRVQKILRGAADERRVIQLNVFRDLMPQMMAVAGPEVCVEAWDALYRASTVWP
jgi:hypothetical protein